MDRCRHASKASLDELMVRDGVVALVGCCALAAQAHPSLRARQCWLGGLEPQQLRRHCKGGTRQLNC